MAIQSAAAILVVLYFNIESVREASAWIGESKTKSGLLGAFVAGFIAGGCVPELAKWATGKLKSWGRKDWGRLVWAGFVYGIVGILVDILYRLQAIWFGHGNDLGTVAIKVAVDMTAFTLLISFPVAASLFAWWREGFRMSFWREAFSWRFYRDEILSKVPLGWSFWIPILALTYALPLPLQFPFAMLAEAAWSVLFVFMILGGSEERAGSGGP